MSLSREAVGGGTENPAIIATDALIQKELSPDYDEQLQEENDMEKNGGTGEVVQDMEC